MESCGSVTRLLRGLQEGDEQAATHLWDKYFQRLVGAARARLGTARVGAGDAEDVALSAFFSFCQRVEQGRFADLQGRQDLWKVLIVIAKCKAISWIRHETAEKRGGGHLRGEAYLADMVAPDPTPSFTAELLDEIRHLLDLLHREDATLSLIAQRKLEGYSNTEIASELSLSPRSVQRKFQRICIIWQADVDNRIDSESPEGGPE